MIIFVLRIIVIENCSARGFPLEEASEHCFLSIKVLILCCGFIYYVVPLLFSTIFLFSAIIIDLVHYRSRPVQGETGTTCAFKEGLTPQCLRYVALLLMYIENVDHVVVY
jgi:hypothetical protein